MTKRGSKSKTTTVGETRNITIPFQGGRNAYVSIKDREKGTENVLVMPLSVELFWPTGKYTPTGTPGLKCLRGTHRPPNKKTGLCTRCGKDPSFALSPTAVAFDSESFDATHRTRGFRS